tara:strand:- start:336 stop:530 length:195 start_codon:yes stop_codon:yes gene_type:complete
MNTKNSDEVVIEILKRIESHLCELIKFESTKLAEQNINNQEYFGAGAKGRSRHYLGGGCGDRPD